MKRSRRIISFTVILMLLLSVCVNAGIYSAWKTTGTINGYKYKYRSGIIKYTWDINGRADTKVVSGSVPSRYIGGRSYIYSVGGTLITASDWAYNSGRCSGIDFCGKDVSAPGTYYCIAKFKYKKNNNKYSSVYTAKATKSVVLKSSKNLTKAQSEYVDNSDFRKVAAEIKTIKGKTYGSGLRDVYKNDMPDMISAVGANGREGYVKSDDLTIHNNKSSDLDGVVLKPGEEYSRFIPVYSTDGLVIDKFEVYTECELPEDIK